MNKILLLGFDANHIYDLKKTFGKDLFSINVNKSYQYSAIVALSRKLFEENIHKINTKNVRWIHLPGAGIENYNNLKNLNNIIFTNTKTIQGPQVSDHAMALLLSLTRKVSFISKYGLKKKFDFKPIELSGKKTLIIGYGGIGKSLVQRASSFDMNIDVVVNSKIKKNPLVRKFFRFDDFKIAIKNKDIIFITCPLTKLTNKLFNSHTINELKDNSILINISRGKIIDTEALITALKNKKFIGVGLDVVDPEPLPGNHELLSFKNVVVTPHIGGISDNYIFRNYKLIKTNINLFINKKTLKNKVNLNRGY